MGENTKPELAKDKKEEKDEEQNIEKENLNPKEKLNKNKVSDKQEKSNKKENSKKNAFKIMGIPVVNLFAFFVVFSILGFFLETIFAIVTKGVIESRKSFLYGPFCAIYGVGAVVMIVGLQKFNKNNYTLFLGGFLIGSVVEYIISWAGEILFDIKWWDYSNMPFNINGRICIWFSIFWGALAIYLMNHVYPKVDKLLSKLSFKTLKRVTTVFVVFMFLDWVVSSFAVKIFLARVVCENNVDVIGKSGYIQDYNLICSNDTIKKVTDTLFSDRIMVKSFPNLKLTGKNGEIILVSDVLTDIDPYYVKLVDLVQLPKDWKFEYFK